MMAAFVPAAIFWSARQGISGWQNARTQFDSHNPCPKEIHDERARAIHSRLSPRVRCGLLHLLLRPQRQAEISVAPQGGGAFQYSLRARKGRVVYIGPRPPGRTWRRSPPSRSAGRPLRRRTGGRKAKKVGTAARPRPKRRWTSRARARDERNVNIAAEARHRQALNHQRRLSLLPKTGPIGPLGPFSLKWPVFAASFCGPVPGPISAHPQQNRPTLPAHSAPLLTAFRGHLILPRADWPGCCAIGPFLWRLT